MKDKYTVEREAVERTRSRYERETEGHTLQILHAAGLYRHLRFTGPGSFYWFDLHTAPQTLTVTGGMGTYTFRIDDQDVLRFFTHGTGANPRYWEEKLKSADRSHGCHGWDVELFEDQVREALSKWQEQLDGDSTVVLESRVEDDVLAYSSSEHHAMEAVRSFTFEGGRFRDVDDWTVHGYSEQYLFCCWAVFHGLKSYLAHCRALNSAS